MEGLRGIAVFLVFLVHFATLMQPRMVGSPLEAWADALHTIGNRGVDLFFVLSGYLIYGSLIGRAQPFGRFLLRRVERIYPAFLFVFAIYLVLAVTGQGERLIPRDPTRAALYLGANLLLLPGLAPIEPLITVAWSLSYELFYYLTIPLVVTGLALRQRSRMVRAFLFSAIAAGLAGYCFFRAGPVRLVMFVAGIVLFETIKGRRLTPPNMSVVLFSVATAFGANLIPTLGSTGYMWKTMLLFVAFYALCFTCFERPGTALVRTVSATPLRWLGNMSYSYYLLHGLALKIAFAVLDRIFPPTPVGPTISLALLVLMFVVTLPPTVALFLFVEYPLSLSPRRPWRTPNRVEEAALAMHRPNITGSDGRSV